MTFGFHQIQEIGEIIIDEMTTDETIFFQTLKVSTEKRTLRNLTKI